MRPTTDDEPLAAARSRPAVDAGYVTRAEASALAALAGPVSAILAAYLLDAAGIAFSPAAMLAVVLLASVASAALLLRPAMRTSTDGPMLGLVVGATLA